MHRENRQLVFVFVPCFVFGAHEVFFFYHLVSFPSSRETVSRPGIELSTTSFGLGTFPLSFGRLGSSRTGCDDEL